MPLSNQLADDVDSFTLDDWCRRNGISRSMFYVLKEQGKAPATFNIGRRVMVSKEANRAWRRQRERASRQPA
jgi:hypothetical protein